MRVLVTGGAGFIGSHLVDRLLAEGIETAVLDDLSTGHRENLPAEVRLYPVDLRDAPAVHAAVRDFAPTHIGHLAAQASVKRSVDNPAEDAAINIVGGLHLLEAAYRAGVQKLVFASTGGALYGEVAGVQRADETWPARPHSPYAASKAAFESYLRVFQDLHGLEHVVLRYANVYGPRQDPHGEAGVVAIFCNRLLGGETVQVNARCSRGDDGCVRDYIHVHDVVEANLRALQSSWSGIYNVGTGLAHTTREVLTSLARALDLEPHVQSGPHRAGDIERSVLDPTRLLNTGWGPPLGLEEGLRRTALWFRDRRAASVR